jgi:hypothetical protein
VGRYEEPETMTKAEFDLFTKEVDAKLGNPAMTCEGPEPHDFRRMKERGVRFVHSGLFVHVPTGAKIFTESGTVLNGIPCEDWAPDGKVKCKIVVADDAAAEEIMQIVRAAGFEPRYDPPTSPGYYGTVFFDATVEGARP